MVQPWNLGPPSVDFSALGKLGDSFTNAFDGARKKTALANIGQDLQSGNYDAAAQKAFATGDVNTGLGIMKLGQGAKDRAFDQTHILGNGSPSSLGVPTGGSSDTTHTYGNFGSPNDVEKSFIDTVKGAGLTNPVGLAAVAATARAESGFSPGNVNRTWSDPSASGQAGTSGGTMSWRAERLQNLQRFAAARGEQGNGSPTTQALFFAQEDPTLIPRLNAAKTPEEASGLMAQAWRFAGYDKPGGEAGRRTALTRHYASRYGRPVAVAENEADVQRLEAEQAARQAPFQIAQAPSQPGTPVADLPSANAARAEGFAIPGTPASLGDDPKVQEWQRKLATARTESGQKFAQRGLDLAVKDAEKRIAENAPTDAVRNYRFYRQEEQAAGREPISFQAFRESTSKGTTVNVGGGSDKQIFDNMEKGTEAAQSAATGLQSIREARRAVEAGGFFGAGADFKLGFQKAAAALGIGDPAALAKITNTETFRSAIAPQIAATMKATVGSTQISNADRDFAEKAAGGSITLDPSSIKRLLGIMEKASNVIIERHQKRLDTVYPEAEGKFARERALFGVATPQAEPEPTAASDSGWQDIGGGIRIREKR